MKSQHYFLALTVAVAAAYAATQSNAAEKPTSSSQAKVSAPILSGKWLLTTSSSIGVRSVTMYIAQVGKKITGHTESGTSHSVFHGSIDGPFVSWSTGVTEDGEVKQKEIPMDFNGVVEGDEMRGKAILGVFGKATWTAKRIP